MAKKQTKKKSPRGVPEKTDEACVALIREYFRRKGFDVHESDIDGAHVFSDVFATAECVVSFVRCVIVVEDNNAKVACEIPLRVPKSRIPEVLRFVNHMNSEDLGNGTLFLDPESSMVTMLNDCHTSVIKSDVDKAMEDFIAPMILTAGVCGDTVLEIITDGSLPEPQGAKQKRPRKRMTRP